jgi:hypothetical protein
MALFILLEYCFNTYYTSFFIKCLFKCHSKEIQIKPGQFLFHRKHGDRSTLPSFTRESQLYYTKRTAAFQFSYFYFTIICLLHGFIPARSYSSVDRGQPSTIEEQLEYSINHVERQKGAKPALCGFAPLIAVTTTPLKNNS